MKYNNDEDLIAKTPNSLKNGYVSAEQIAQYEEWLQSYSQTLGLAHAGASEDELKATEQRLGIDLPPALRLLYACVGKDKSMLVSCLPKQNDVQILSLDQLSVVKNVPVHDYYEGDAWFETDVLIIEGNTKTKMAPIYGIDLKRGWGLTFNKVWYWQKDGFPLPTHLLIALACIAISTRQSVFKTRVKGVSTLAADKSMAQRLEGYFERFPHLEHYGHTLFFDLASGSLGWFRSGSTVNDFLVGSNNLVFIQKLVNDLQFDKAKFLKPL